MNIEKDRRFVVFSDIHIGAGGGNDDFAQNARLFTTVLEHYYYPRDYTLLLNGDVEELQKFRLPSIYKRWRSVFELFHRFEKGPGLFKIVGNHDHSLYNSSFSDEFPLYDSVRMDSGGNIIYLFHGHQASLFFTKYNDISGFLLRYLVHPLGIKNVTSAHESVRRYNTEKHVYDFSTAQKIVSIIGHTHRPLFESLSKIDTIKFKIENLCRKYPNMEKKEKEAAEKEIKTYKNELQNIYRKDPSGGKRSSLYNSQLLVPCLFNSGCVIGKRGITAVEFGEDRIALVHWFDNTISKKYLSSNGDPPFSLPGTHFFKKILKRDHLSYIFTRINLLA